MDADQGVAVAALVASAGRSSVERRAPVALARRRAPPAASSGASVESSRPSRRASRYGGSRKTRSYGVAAPPCVAEERAGVPRGARRRRDAERREVGAQRRAARRGSRSTNVALRGAARQRLDAQRAGAGEQVEDARAVERRRATQNSASRTRSEVGRVPRPGGAASRRPPKRPGDDPHARRARGTRRRGLGRAASASRRAARARARASSGSASSSAAARACARSSTSASSGSRAKRKRARPDWRVPVSSPSPRSSRSISARRKPSACSAQRLAAARDSVGPEQQAQRRVLAAADAAAQLVQLARCRSARRPRRASRSRWARRCRPRSPSSRRARRPRRRRTRPSPPASRAGASGRASGRRRKSRELAVAQALELGGRGARLQRLGLLDERADDERLAAGAQLLADALVGARALALAARRRASRSAGGPRGSSRSAVTSRAPNDASAQRARDRRRGHVQHVRREARPAPWRRARRAGARRSGAARRRPRPRGRSKSTGVLDQRVGADDERQLAAWRACRAASRAARRRRRAGQQRGRDERRPASAPGASRSAARRASRSAPSARPACRARRRAASRAARRRSCPSRPRPSAGAASAARARGRRRPRPSRAAWSPVGVNGSCSSRQRRGQRRRLVERRRRARSPRRSRAQAQLHELVEQQLVERQPPAAALVVAEVRGGAARAARVGQPLGDAQPRRAAARRRRAIAVAVLADERQDLRRRDALRRRVLGDGVADRGDLARSRACVLTRKRLRPWYLPVQHQPRARAGTGAASHGWLKNVAFITPVASATVASTSGFIPRRRTGRLRIAAHLDEHRRASRRARARRPCAPRRCRAAGARAGRRRSRSPSASAASAALACGRLQRLGEPRRARPAHRRLAQLVAASSSSVAAKARGVRTIGRAGSALLRGEQPPPARLAAVRELELDAVGRERLDRASSSSGAPSPAMQRDELGAVAERARAPSRSVGLGLAPGDDLLVDEADGVADREAALRRPRARRARRRRCAARASASLHRRGVLARRCASGISATAAGRPACWERVGTTTTVLLGQLGGALGGHDHVRRCWAARRPPRRRTAWMPASSS